MIKSVYSRRGTYSRMRGEAYIRGGDATNRCLDFHPADTRDGEIHLLHDERYCQGEAFFLEEAYWLNKAYHNLRGRQKLGANWKIPEAKLRDRQKLGAKWKISENFRWEE